MLAALPTASTNNSPMEDFFSGSRAYFATWVAGPNWGEIEPRSSHQPTLMGTRVQIPQLPCPADGHCQACSTLAPGFPGGIELQMSTGGASLVTDSIEYLFFPHFPMLQLVFPSLPK